MYHLEKKILTGKVRDVYETDDNNLVIVTTDQISAFDKDEVNSDFLLKKSYEKIGERDIAGRSLRNFLSTLTDFGLLVQEERSVYKWADKLDLSEENLINFFRLYSKFYLKSPQISLYDLTEHIFFYFNIPDLQEIAQKYNNIHWQYVRRVNTALITMK